MTQITHRRNQPQKSKQAEISQALQSHAKNQMAQRIDAKSILLVDESGTVQKPTNQTLSLLGVRTSAKRLRAQNQASYEQENQAVVPKDEDQINLLGFSRPGKRFRGQGAQNEEQDAGQVFKCAFESCQKEFRSARHLKTHLAYHKLRANFVCPVPSCGKSFNYRHNLSMHMRVHNDHRPFTCPQNCGKSFRTKGNMMDHLRRHYAIKPYKCHLCGQSFYRNNILKEHIARCTALRPSQADQQDQEADKADGILLKGQNLGVFKGSSGQTQEQTGSVSSRKSASEASAPESDSNSQPKKQVVSSDERSEAPSEPKVQLAPQQSPATELQSKIPDQLENLEHATMPLFLPAMMPDSSQATLMAPAGTCSSLLHSFEEQLVGLETQKARKLLTMLQQQLLGAQQPQQGLSNLKNLIQQLLQLQHIMNEIKSNAQKSQLLDLLKFAKELLNCVQPMPAANKATLIVPPKFNEAMPATPLDEAVLAQMEDYDFDVHIQNYFTPFGPQE